MPIRKLALTDYSARYNPKDSWWIRPREGFTAECDRQWPRMRSSFWGLRSTQTRDGRGLSSVDLYRAKKNLAKRVAVAW